MIRIGRAKNGTGAAAAAAGDAAAPAWLYRSEAFAEDLTELVTTALPQSPPGAAPRRMRGGLDGLLEGAGHEDRGGVDGRGAAGAGLLGWARRLHWQGA
ncbi:MAG: hypothetical protein JNL85_03835 [Rubrivivax sp.]|nr:hypothetical protein [Rubrivivax sp.]